MNALLATILDAVQAAEKNGATSIPTADLKRYLGSLQSEMGDNGSDAINQARLEQYKVELSRWLEDQKHAKLWDFELFRSTITAGQAALRSAILINGGAAVALLAFLGNLLDSQPELVAKLAESLNIFLYGVLSAAVASGSTYLAQWWYSGSSEFTRIAGNVFNVLTILLVAGSYASFLVAALRPHPPLEPNNALHLPPSICHGACNPRHSLHSQAPRQILPGK